LNLNGAQPTPFSGPVYEGEIATQKSSQLHTAVMQSNKTGPWYSFEELELFIESMNVSFENVGDDMPYQFLGLERRPKLIHSVGVIAMANWVAQPGTPYTGVLGFGCKNLIIRLSLARQPDSTSTPYTLGIALKCLRDGVPSGNLFAMYSLQGQDSWNFFKHDLTNHVPDLNAASAGFVLSQLRKRFEEASRYPVMIGLSDLAKYTDDGIPFQRPTFPFRLIFHPSLAWHTFYPDTQPSTTFQNQLASTLRPGLLYDIYAQDTPDSTSALKIGTLNLLSGATTSHFGDTLMFFQHTSLESDLMYRPEWGPKAQAIMQFQQSQPNYVYPDIPW